MGGVRNEVVGRCQVSIHHQPQLLLPIVAKAKDSLVIIFLVAFFGLLILQGVRIFAKHIDQQNHDRRQFYLFVAAELDKMDKIVAEGNQPKEQKEPELLLPTKNWVGRN